MKLSRKLITVCDSCLCASCWQGVFYCDNHKQAGITQLTKAKLRKLNREHSCYWKTDIELAARKAQQ